MYNLIEDYLDRLTMPLVRRLPYHERHRIRQEIRDHLIERVQEITAQGTSADEAVALAIRQFGTPEWVGTLLLEKYRPIARLNWWRAILLLCAVLIVSLALPVANRRDPKDARSQQVVDAMLWTGGSAILFQMLRAEQMPQDLPMFRHVGYSILTVPPLSSDRPVQEPSLRSLESLLQERYVLWWNHVERNTPRADLRWMLPDRYIIVPWHWREIAPSDRNLGTAFRSVCGSMRGCVSLTEPHPPIQDAVWVAIPLAIVAFVSGAVMRRGRWAAGTVLAAVLLSLLWCSMIALEINAIHSRDARTVSALTQMVTEMERLARQSPSLFQSSRSWVPLEQMNLASNAERPERILQLAKLYHHYRSDYLRRWQEWDQAGVLGQTWRVFRTTVLPVWWTIPLAGGFAAFASWLGVVVSIWSWRVRNFVVYRYA